MVLLRSATSFLLGSVRGRFSLFSPCISLLFTIHGEIATKSPVLLGSKQYRMADFRASYCDCQRDPIWDPKPESGILKISGIPVFPADGTRSCAPRPAWLSIGKACFPCCTLNVRFSTDYVRSTPQSRRGWRSSRRSAVDPERTFADPMQVATGRNYMTALSLANSNPSRAT